MHDFSYITIIAQNDVNVNRKVELKFAIFRQIHTQLYILRYLLKFWDFHIQKSLKLLKMRF